MLRLVLVVLVWHWVAAEKSVFKVLENLQPTQKCQQQLGEFVRNWALNENSWALQSKYYLNHSLYYYFV